LYSSQESNPWTDNDENILCTFLTEYGGKVSLVPRERLEAAFPTRTLSSITQKMRRIMRSQKMTPEHIKGHWTDEEDAKLLEGVKEYGHTWENIAQGVFKGRRNAIQIKLRYSRLAKRDVKEFSPEEDDQLLTSAGKFGKDFRRIQLDVFPERTRVALKGRAKELSMPERAQERPFTHRELRCLRATRDKLGPNWVAISKTLVQFGYLRSPEAWFRAYRDPPQITSPEAVFTPEQDAQLWKLVEQHLIDWKMILSNIKAADPLCTWSELDLEERYIEIWQQAHSSPQQPVAEDKKRDSSPERSVNPSVTPDQDAMLHIGQRRYLLPDQISSFVCGSRTTTQIVARFSYLSRRDQRQFASSFTPEMDAKLLSVVQQHGEKWQLIKENYFPHLSKTWIKERYFRVLYSMQGHAVSKGPWTQNECRIIREALPEHRHNYKHLSKLLNNSRTPAQIAKFLARHQILPSSSSNFVINKVFHYFTPDEDARLIQAVKDFGPKWKTISEKVFNGKRTPPSLSIRARRLQTRASKSQVEM
jgi:hypothetical protein